VSGWRRDARTLLLAFFGAVLGGIGGYVGSLIVNYLKLVQLGPSEQAIAALVVSMIAGYSILIWTNLRLRRSQPGVALARGEGSVKAEPLSHWEFWPLHDVSKVLNRVGEELVVSHWWPDSTTIRVEAGSSDNMDFAVKFSGSVDPPLLTIQDHSRANIVWTEGRTKKWAKEFKTQLGAGVWYFVATRPVGNIAVGTAAIRVFELRRILNSIPNR